MAEGVVADVESERIAVLVDAPFAAGTRRFFASRQKLEGALCMRMIEGRDFKACACVRRRTIW